MSRQRQNSTGSWQEQEFWLFSLSGDCNFVGCLIVFLLEIQHFGPICNLKCRENRFQTTLTQTDAFAKVSDFVNQVEQLQNAFATLESENNKAFQYGLGTCWRRKREMDYSQMLRFVTLSLLIFLE